VALVARTAVRAKPTGPDRTEARIVVRGNDAHERRDVRARRRGDDQVDPDGATALVDESVARLENA
jgi:hypothetical protein